MVKQLHEQYSNMRGEQQDIQRSGVDECSNIYSYCCVLSFRHCCTLPGDLSTCGVAPKMLEISTIYEGTTRKANHFAAAVHQVPSLVDIDTGRSVLMDPSLPSLTSHVGHILYCFLAGNALCYPTLLAPTSTREKTHAQLSAPQ